jgi:hypothetical protein
MSLPATSKATSNAQLSNSKTNKWENFHFLVSNTHVELYIHSPILLTENNFFVFFYYAVNNSTSIKQIAVSINNDLEECREKDIMISSKYSYE